MNLRSIYLILIIASCAPAANAADHTRSKEAFLGQVKIEKITTTKGYIGDSHVSVKSTTKGKTTTTKGWVNGEYVRIKTKKDGR